MNLRDAELEQSLDRPGFRLRGTSIREALGGELIGGTLYEFDPGEQLWPYHFHRGNEEWLVVVAGTPSLRTPDGERELRPGDVVGFPEGEAGAHTLYNRSDGPSASRSSRPCARARRSTRTAARSASPARSSAPPTRSTTGTGER